MGNSLAVGVGVRKSSLGGTGGGDRVILHISGYRLSGLTNSEFLMWKVS